MRSHLIERHQGAQGREAVWALSEQPLTAVLLQLPVSCRHVVRDGVAYGIRSRCENALERAAQCCLRTCDVRHGVFGLDATSCLANNDGELDFEVQFRSLRWLDQGVAGGADGSRKLAEDHRLNRNRHVLLRAVVGIVHTHTEDLLPAQARVQECAHTEMLAVPHGS